MLMIFSLFRLVGSDERHLDAMNSLFFVQSKDAESGHCLKEQQALINPTSLTFLTHNFH